MPARIASARHRVARWARGYGLFAALCLLWLLATFSSWWFSNVLAWSAGLLYVAYDTWLLAFVAYQTRHLADPRNGGSVAPMLPAGTGPRLGVVVPARNEAAVLRATLDPLLAMLEPGDALLLVDDGSTDGSAALLATHYGVRPAPGRVASQHPQFSVWFKPNSGKADSLNVGWRTLSQPVMVTVDADTRLDPGALAGFRAAFAAEPALVAAGGILTPQTQGGGLARAFGAFQQFEYLRAFLARAAWMRCGALLLVSGAFAAYRREALEAVDGFDPQCLVEDYELIHRLHRHAHDTQQRWTVRVLSTPRAVTDAPATVRAFLQQRRRWFAGFLQTQYRYRALHGDARYGAVGRLMLPIKAVDTLQPLFGLTAFALLVVFLLSGASVAPLVLGVIAAKLGVDLGYHAWALRHYHRWLSQPLPATRAWQAALVTLAEPFSFQLLRQCGAAWGWWLLLTGQREWAPQRPVASAARLSPANPDLPPPQGSP